MPQYVKRIECCYCSASSLVDLGNSHAMRLICSGCGARMSVDKLAPLATVSAAPIKREIRFEAPPTPQKAERKIDPRWRDDDDDDDDDEDRRRKPKRRKRKTFLKRLGDKLEDVWDEIEDIFD